MRQFVGLCLSKGRVRSGREEDRSQPSSRYEISCTPLRSSISRASGEVRSRSSTARDSRSRVRMFPSQRRYSQDDRPVPTCLPGGCPRYFSNRLASIAPVATMPTVPSVVSIPAPTTDLRNVLPRRAENCDFAVLLPQARTFCHDGYVNWSEGIADSRYAAGSSCP